MNDKHEHESHQGGNGTGASEKDSDYYAGKSGSQQDDGEGGHARRRLDEMISHRVPDQLSSEKEPGKESMAETPPSEASSPDEEEQSDEGAPDEG
ncbi:hypothetical protein QNO08_07610 [Arthrobacter sp. zg-Y820]|uniref:hypothetical protein n=1 Tax=unclassified Arthrobacter TaxID=235627 RepID=UPI001E618CDD|nr:MULTISPECIES: hypothetical protein [unclassified Arthrobacter]MCC9197615.1 hypothetical protein [Arthrobacter sp. zg-Y820]MDK1280482.1 hypothetical protein [Arthrobacter sp. zg.Y820]WIB10878.1 hypothetical protein QNO08_07610 [Arthrobacter sp. zg-Y820]